MKFVKYLKEFKSYFIIREFAVRLFVYYSNKWRVSVKKVEVRCGEYFFVNFVEFI